MRPPIDTEGTFTVLEGRVTPYPARRYGVVIKNGVVNEPTTAVLDVIVEPDAWPPITAWDADPVLAALAIGDVVG